VARYAKIGLKLGAGFCWIFSWWVCPIKPDGFFGHVPGCLNRAESVAGAEYICIDLNRFGKNWLYMWFVRGRFDGFEVLGDRIGISWYKDVRKARAYGKTSHCRTVKISNSLLS